MIISKSLTVRDRRRELAEQQRLQEAIWRRHASDIGGALEDQASGMISAYVESGGSEIVLETEMPGVEDLGGAVASAWRDAAGVFSGRAIESVYEKSIRGIETKQTDGVDPVVDQDDAVAAFWRATEAFIASEVVGEKITAISGTTRDQVRRTIQGAIGEGLSITEAADRAREQVPALTGFRAMVISRTEVHTASNFAQKTAVDSMGLGDSLRREWVSAGDDRTREDHLDADGQVVGQNDKFFVGGERLEYPGAMGGSAANIINCRCGVAYVE